MPPNIMNMEKEPQERDMLQEDCERDGQKPKVRPVETVLERLYHMGYTRRALLIITVLAVIALILLISVIALAARPCCASSSDRPLCITPDCYRATARILEQVNTSADPCKDFYEYACGGWLQNNKPIPDPYGHIGVTVQALRDFKTKSREFIETLDYPVNFRSLSWKMKAFYQSCMNLDGIDSAGDSFLQRHIGLLKGWKPKQDWQMHTWDWATVLRNLHVDYGVFPFFALSVRPDDINPYQNVIQISPSGLGLPHTSYYFRPQDDKVIVAYQALMRDLALNLGITSPDANDFARNVFYFEKRIAEILISEHPDKDKENVKKKITVSELRQISQRINWVDFLKAFYPKAYISESTPVYLVSRHYITELSTILSTTDKGALNNYLIWTLIFKYAPYLSKDFIKTVDTYRGVLSDSIAPRARWDFCVEATNDLFSVALNSFYVQNHVSKHTLIEANKIFYGVKDAFANTIKDMSWMNSSARSTSNKVKNIESKLFDDIYVLSEQELDSYYEPLEISRVNFVDNIQNGAIFKRYQMDVALANASRLYMNSDIDKDSSLYYSEFMTNVPLPVLLQEPFVHSSYPKYMVFGALGSKLSYDLIRSIEENENGISKGYTDPISWNNVTLLTSYQECLIHNYSRFKLDDYQTDGNNTLSSNLADVGGLNQAYKAMIRSEENGKLEPLLPALTYTPEQLFFISFAQTMCSSTRKAYLDNYVHLSKSPPDKIRILGATSQVPQFSKAFGCSPVPEHCTFW